MEGAAGGEGRFVGGLAVFFLPFSLSCAVPEYASRYIEKGTPRASRRGAPRTEV